MQAFFRQFGGDDLDLLTGDAPPSSTGAGQGAAQGAGQGAAAEAGEGASAGEASAGEAASAPAASALLRAEMLALGLRRSSAAGLNTRRLRLLRELELAVGANRNPDPSPSPNPNPSPNPSPNLDHSPSPSPSPNTNPEQVGELEADGFARANAEAMAPLRAQLKESYAAAPPEVIEEARKENFFNPALPRLTLAEIAKEFLELAEAGLANKAGDGGGVRVVDPRGLKQRREERKQGNKIEIQSAEARPPEQE